MSDHAHAGFTDRVRLGEARSRLRDIVDFHGRTERVDLGTADGRTLAEPVAADRDVPHYDRAAMDGFAVRAADTFGASDRSPVELAIAGTAADSLESADSRDPVGPGEAVRVHTGSPLPDGADAVVVVERAREFDGRIEVPTAVPAGDNVAPVGEDVAAGQALFEPGHRLRPSDLGLLRAVGRREVAVRERPRVAVVPTGEEVVEADPGPGEVVDTNGPTAARYVERWGGTADLRDVVTDDRAAIRDAIGAAGDADLVVTTGGSSVGERDLVPDVVAGLGEVAVHGVALRPGHPVAVGAAEGTPVVMLPGYPVSTIVTAVQLLRPALKLAGGMPVDEPPRADARLDRKVQSEPGLRSFVRVRVEARDGERVAVPVRESGAGVLSSVALADGWVVVPESREGIPAGETVAVEDWEWWP